jgi:hypothetical protein
MLYTLLEKRIKILNSLGGITKPAVYKQEWSALITEEARNSIMIEGYYVPQKEAEAVLAEKERARTTHSPKAVSYHNASSVYYGQAYSDFQRKSFGFIFDDFRKLNGMILLDENLYPGLRRDSIRMPDGGECPDFVDVPLLLEMYLDYVRKGIEKFFSGRMNIKAFAAFLAKQHGYFEAVHPLEDGNGRVGRILTNYILTACGLPLIVLKGEDKDREEYFAGIKEFKDQLGFTLSLPQSYHNIPDKLDDITSGRLAELFAELMAESLDAYLCGILEQKGFELKPLSTMRIGFSILKKSAERHNFLAIKRGKEWFSHEDFDLRNDKLKI